jgi:hypothetical protein
MKRFFLIAILFLPFFLFAQKVKEGNFILWSKDRSLTWADFKGGVVQTSKDQKATTCSQITMTPDNINKIRDSVKYIISAQMVKNKSWKIKASTTDYLLKHEQLHFDITELYIRILRKAISETLFKKKTFSDQIENLYKKCIKSWEAEQKKYDKETNHSINELKQEEWNKKIAYDLETYDSYFDPIVIIYVK